jgi:hypothetical protein
VTALPLPVIVPEAALPLAMVKDGGDRQSRSRGPLVWCRGQISDDLERDLNRWLPLGKWLLAFPHYIVLSLLWIGAFVAIVAAWFASLVTGRHPQALFDYVVGVSRWSLVTDRYPPFSLK